MAATVKGFTTIKVTAELSGYAAVTQKFYVKKTTTRVNASLKKLPRRPR